MMNAGAGGDDISIGKFFEPKPREAGSIDTAVMALLERGRERREAKRGEAPFRPVSWG